MRRSSRDCIAGLLHVEQARKLKFQYLTLLPLNCETCYNKPRLNTEGQKNKISFETPCDSFGTFSKSMAKPALQLQERSSRRTAGAKEANEADLRPKPLHVRKKSTTTEQAPAMSEMLGEVRCHKQDVKNAKIQRKIDNALDRYAELGTRRQK